MGQTAVLGFGNPCRSDDGVGIFVIDELKKQISPSAPVTLLDMGTGAFELLFHLKGHDRLLLVDAVVNTGEPAGTLYKLPAEVVERAPVDDPLVFLHSMKWDQALSYARKILGTDYPDRVEVYLIAVEDTRLEIGLSDPVRDAGLQVVGHIIVELELIAAVNG